MIFEALLQVLWTINCHPAHRQSGYRLHLPQDSKIHNVFHVSQLKPFIADYPLVFSKLPSTTGIEASNSIPEAVLDKRLVPKGNTTPQVMIKWSGLPETTI
jgi:hypothetical protein